MAFFLHPVKVSLLCFYYSFHFGKCQYFFIIFLSKTESLYNMYNKEVTSLSIIGKIESLLIEQNKSQKDLTSFLGVGEPVFTKWKTGMSKSYTKYLDKISVYFNVPVDCLLENEQKEKAPVEKTEAEILFNLYEQADEHIRKAVDLLLGRE